MTDQEYFRLRSEHLTIDGRSRAGHETWFRIREIGIALDIGRCPDSIIGMREVFITHAHLDHAAGIPFYAAQRSLQGLDPGIIYVPAEAADDLRSVMKLQQKLTGARLDTVIRGMAPGEEIQTGRSYSVRAWKASHRVAALAYQFFELRHRLRSELRGLGPEEIARRHRDGVRVDEEYRRPVLFYTGDTDRGLLETCEALYESEVLMIECSFVAEGHQERAARYRHIHLDDIAEFADRFRNEMVVLTHFSRRYSPQVILDAVRRRIPSSLRERIRLALPEQWQRP